MSNATYNFVFLMTIGCMILAIWSWIPLAGWATICIVYTLDDIAVAIRHHTDRTTPNTETKKT